MRPDFIAAILTHGRPDNVLTYETLRRQGYTGPILFLIDNQDAQGDEYIRAFGEKPGVTVHRFDKEAEAEGLDLGDNQLGLRTDVVARRVAYKVVREMGFRYFVQLDDDYIKFDWRFTDRAEYVTAAHFEHLEHCGFHTSNLDRVFEAFVRFLTSTPAKTVAMAQGGDFIGGQHGRFGKVITLRRKAMNSFFCDVERPIDFVGRLNGDVNTYVSRTVRGDLFLTHNVIALNQVAAAAGKGGMSDAYVASGSYAKSFYTVMWHPSGVKVRMMNNRSRPRLHHSVDWSATAPKIVSESIRRDR